MTESAQSTSNQAHRHAAPEPIAIIGIGCRFPGGVKSPATFWDLVYRGVDAITTMPLSRFPQSAYDDSPPASSMPASVKPGKIATRQGGFLDEIEKFDAQFFDVAPREAKAMDPQQRLLLETTWEAIEDAGITRPKLIGSNTGVYVGMWTSDYEDTLFATSNDIDLYMTTGGGRYAAAGRLSFVFDLQGPSLTVDTACSSSLVAVHLACQSLWAGETEMALAGAVNLILQPFISIGYSRSRMLSPDGRCKFGDAHANGYVRSEGCATVVLKPLSRALADNDRIYALIRGTATNNDGHSSDLLVTPSGHGQLAMLRQAYRQAGVNPGEVDYVEAHGTGTPVGDPVELQALGAVLAEGRRPDRPCSVGSVKTNIGHTEAASGMAGLIKAALSLKHGAIPASLHFETPNPKIPWHDLPLVMQRSLGLWPANSRPRFAGVNSFGVTGTNAHVVLQEAPANSAPLTSSDTRPQLLALSAQSPAALRAAARDLGTHIAAHPPALGNLAYTLGQRRTHLNHRLAFVANHPDEATATLQAFAQNGAAPGLVSGEARTPAPNIVFVFPGQGSQWLGMARDLLAEAPVFRAAIERCDRAIVVHTNWSVLHALESDDAAYLDEIDQIQPALFAIQVALAALWQSWGIEPAAVVGHSMGEVAAAHSAGALSLDDAARIICQRSRLLRRVRGQGAMAMVELTFAEAEAAIEGYRDRVAVAVSNAPRSTVISGDPAAIESIIGELQRRDIFCRPVKVDVASHSPQMDPLLGDLHAVLEGLVPTATRVLLYSTVDSAIAAGTALDAGYWVRNLRQPVRFAQSIQQLIDAGHTCFIEISPHPILLPALQQLLQQTGTDSIALATLRRGEPSRATALISLGALYTAGADIAWAAVGPASARQISLPTYPWQRERFWYEPVERRSSARTGHPLLGERFMPAGQTSQYWETTLNLTDLAFLADHRPRGAVVLPATGFIEMALAAVDASYGTGTHRLENLVLSDVLVLATDAPRPVQVELTPHLPGNVSVRIYSALEAGPKERHWQLHAEAVVQLNVTTTDATDAPLHVTPAVIQARCTQEISPQDHYHELEGRELVYGPAFQTVLRVWRGDGETLGQVRATASTALAEHITLLDGCLQLAVATLAASTSNTPYLPVSVEALQIFNWPSGEAALWAHAVVTGHAGVQVICDVFLLDGAGQVLTEIRGLHLQPVARTQAANPNELRFDVKWVPQTLAASSPQPISQRWLILAGDTVSETLAAQLTADGAQCVLAQPGISFAKTGPSRYTLDPANPDHLRTLLQSESAFSNIIHTWSLAANASTDAEFVAAQELCAGSIVNLVQAIVNETDMPAPRLWLVTRNAQAVNDAPTPLSTIQAGAFAKRGYGLLVHISRENFVGAQHAAPLPRRVPLLANTPIQALAWGIGRTLANEHPELRCTLIDLDPADAPTTQAQQLLREFASSEIKADDQIAWRDGARFVARLAHHQPQISDAPAPIDTAPILTTGDDQPYRLVASAPGALDSLQLQPVSRRAPGPDEIEVRVDAAALNFIDVLKAMGIYPGLEPSPSVALGSECAGTIVAVGTNVASLSIGDRVTVITPSFANTSCLSAYVTVPAAFAVPTPASLSQTEAASLPIVFMTAYYALHELGRMRAGERVLIHSAAGGVGLAAIQLCQRAGAIVFATAGSPAKRDFLRSLGVQHVYDSRTLDFAGQIMADTNGAGVDLVLNSLTGAAIPRSLEILASRGRFLEIGKRDIYADSRIGLAPFRKNLSFFAIDLARWTDEDPAGITELFRAVMSLVASGEVKPLPLEVFPIGAAADAFRSMAQARHTGKIVIALGDEPVQVTQMPSTLIRADATYLITGGLGGLGLETAHWLVSRGARHIALLARSAPSLAAQQAILQLEASGAQVQVVAADVANAAQLSTALQHIATRMPQLRGIIHAAGVLADATLAQMDHQQLLAALAPKVRGAWNLHNLTHDMPLDFFVMFSSVAALLGLPGQANYAAANAFLDTLAHQRRADGLTALSINWGPWAGVGLAAAERNRGERLAGRGLGSLSAGEGMAAFEALLRADATQATVMRFDAQRWAAPAHNASNPLLADLGPNSAQLNSTREETSLRTAVLEAEPGKGRRTLLETFVRAQLAQVLHIAPNRIEGHKPLKTMGLDSLMALELRNLLEAGSGLTLSATLAWNYPTVTAIANHLAGLLAVPGDVPVQATNPPMTTASPHDDVSIDAGAGDDDDDIEAMLNAELAAADRLLGRK